MPKRRDRKLQIYFSAPSITTDEQKDLFVLIRNIIKDLGYDLTYDWIADKAKDTPRCVFKKAQEGINLADIVVAEITFPSTGVGQQIAIAKTKKIPVIALYLSNKGSSSRFTTGSENELQKTVGYERNTLKSVLEQLLSELGKDRFERFNFISTPEINSVLEEKSRKLGITRSQLLRQIVNDWMGKNSALAKQAQILEAKVVSLKTREQPATP